MKIIIFLMFSLVMKSECKQKYFHKFVIVCPFYNAEVSCLRTLESLVDQTYPRHAYRILCIDDHSSDGTCEIIERFIKNHPRGDRITFIANKTRRLLLANLYDAVHACDDDEIIVRVDGDDSLINNHVLEYINRIYRKNDVWMTYGQCLYDCPGHERHRSRGISRSLTPHLIKSRAYRSYPPYVFSHLRTYYAWIFKKIKLKDLLDETYFYPRAEDCATMFPIAEMCGKKFMYNDEPLYLYSFRPGVADELQKKCAQKIRGLKRYPRVIKKPTHSENKIALVIEDLSAKDKTQLHPFLYEIKKIVHNVYIIKQGKRKSHLHEIDTNVFIGTAQNIKSKLALDDIHYVLCLPVDLYEVGIVSLKYLIDAFMYASRSKVEGIFLGADFPLKERRPLNDNFYVLVDSEVSLMNNHKTPLLMTKEAYLSPDNLDPRLFLYYHTVQTADMKVM